jgi:hypothetical protein
MCLWKLQKEWTALGIILLFAVAGFVGIQYAAGMNDVRAASDPLTGPPPIWSTVIDYNAQSILLYPERLIETADGGYAVLSRITSHINGTVWLGQFDAQGSLLWERVYKIDYMWGSGSPKDLYQCVDGGFAIIGTTPNIHGDMTHFLIRTEPGGILRWKTMFPLIGGNNDQGGCSIIECTDGGFAMTGWRTAQFFLYRTDADGDYLWHQLYSSLGSSFVDFVQCDDGGFALAGMNSSEFIALTRTNATGGILWKHDYTFPSAPLGLSFSGLKRTHDNEFVLYGETYGQGGNSAAFDIFLLRTNMNGVTLWNYTYGGPLHDHVYDVVQCNDGGFALIGGTWRVGEDFRDIWLVRTDSVGNQNWNCSYPDFLPKGTWGVGIVEPNPGVLVICADIWQSSSSLWLFAIPDSAPPNPNIPFLIPPELIPGLIIGLAIVCIIVIFAMVLLLRQRRV